MSNEGSKFDNKPEVTLIKDFGNLYEFNLKDGLSGKVCIRLIKLRDIVHLDIREFISGPKHSRFTKKGIKFSLPGIELVESLIPQIKEEFKKATE